MSFRIDPRNGLSQQEIIAAQNLAETIENDVLFKEDDGIKGISFDRRCDLVVKHALNSDQTLYLRGKCIGTRKVRHLCDNGYYYFRACEFDNEKGFEAQTTKGFASPSWERGIELKNIGPDLWTIPISIVLDKTDKIAFKFLINDKEWEEGENHNLQDLLFLTHKSFNLANKKFQGANSSFDRFRVDPTTGLSEQEVAVANKLKNAINFYIPFVEPVMKCYLIVKQKLNSGERHSGERLYLRGKCDSWFVHSLKGLAIPSWDNGILLDEIQPDTWVIPITFHVEKIEQVAFKFLINDCDWEAGKNHNLQDLLFLIQKG